MGRSWIRPCSLFSKICNGLLFRWSLRMYRPNLKFVALPVSEIIAIAVLGWGGDPQSCWEGEAAGGRNGTVRKSVIVTSYRLSIVTFRLSLRVSEILPLLCSRTPLFPTTLSLPKITLCSPSLLIAHRAMRSEGVGLIVRAISCVVLIHQRCRQTVRQTDGRTDDMHAQYRALH